MIGIGRNEEKIVLFGTDGEIGQGDGNISVQKIQNFIVEMKMDMKGCRCGFGKGPQVKVVVVTVFKIVYRIPLFRDRTGFCVIISNRL